MTFPGTKPYPTCCRSLRPPWRVPWPKVSASFCYKRLLSSCSFEPRGNVSVSGRTQRGRGGETAGMSNCHFSQSCLKMCLETFSPSLPLTALVASSRLPWPGRRGQWRRKKAKRIRGPVSDALLLEMSLLITAGWQGLLRTFFCTESIPRVAVQEVGPKGGKQGCESWGVAVEPTLSAMQQLGVQTSRRVERGRVCARARLQPCKRQFHSLGCNTGVSKFDVILLFCQ